MQVEHRGLVNVIWDVGVRRVPAEQFALTLFSTTICFDQSVTELFVRRLGSRHETRDTRHDMR